jgi:lipopolysaccharide/colanic/teichoic acid biosynthesis glycosyltransferase
LTLETVRAIPGGSKSGTILQTLDLVVTGLSFWAALWLYLRFVDPLAPDFPPITTGVKIVLAAFIYWSVPKIVDRGEYGGAHGNWFQMLCLSAGAVILSQTVMLYAFHFEPFPLPVLGAGAVFASLLMELSRAWLYPRFSRYRPGAVIVGADSVVRQWIDSFPEPILGFVESDAARVPRGYAFLGSMSGLGDVAASLGPSQIVVGSKNWRSQIPPTLLLDLRLAGIVVKDSGAVYEQVFERACTEELEARELLFSQSMRARRGIMAFQSVYNNLAGLLLLLCALPVLALAALFLRLYLGPDPVLERMHCLGFQGIPFQLLKFRTRRRGSDRETVAGRTISRLGLVGLPQLFNVMRGEMGLIGPAPVRIEFDRWFSERIPFYVHRHSVKPGMTGWAQVHLRSLPVALSEPLGLEYDLYYIKNGSLPLDLEILLKTIVNRCRLLWYH